MRAVLLAALLAASASAQPDPAGTAPTDSTLAAWVAALESRTIDAGDAEALLDVLFQKPERLRAIGFEPSDIRRELLGESHHWLSVDVPRTHFARALASYRQGNVALGDSLFQEAIDNADSDHQRADFYYSRGVSPYGSATDFDRALEFVPSHGPSLYRRAGMFANAIGRATTVEARAAYWCAADLYRQVSEATTDERIASAARRAVEGYERAAPTPEQAAALGWRSGQAVTVTYGDGQTCVTTVR